VATPKSTKPRVAPVERGGYDPEAFPTTDDGPHRPGPVDRSADTVLVTPAGEPADRTAMASFAQPPTPDQRREAKVEAIATSVLSSNPGMAKEAARAVAEATVARFVGVARS
jgi:hypothetical protein